jgi:hypothetical protein
MNTHVDVALIGAGSKPGAIQEPTARTRPEVADHRRGIRTFRDNMGTLSGNGSIPLGTTIRVTCYAPNYSGMSSINDFCLIASGN